MDRDTSNQLAQLENSLLKFCPTRKWEIQTVIFPSTANTDLDIAHKLNPSNPEAVDVTVLSATSPLLVYRDGTANRVAWSQGVIRVRSTTPSARAILLLSVASDTDRSLLDTSGNGFLVSTTAGTVGFDYQSNSSLPDSILGSALHFYGGTDAIPGWALGFQYGGSSDTKLQVMDLDAAMGAPFMFRKLSGDYYLQPGQQTRNVGGKVVKLGNPIDSGSGGYWDAVYALKYYRSDYTAAAQGEWTSVAFSAGNFTASGSMTWTVASGDQTTFAYTRVGKTLTVSVWLVTTTVGGVVSTQLNVAIPGGYTAAKAMSAGCGAFFDNGVGAPAVVSVSAGGTVINVQRADTANLTLATDNTQVRFTFSFEVQ